MKMTRILLLITMNVFFLSCDDEVKLLSAIEDGKELKEGANVPFLLFQNYPNPFNPETTIRYQVGVQMHLRMRVFSDDWQEVKKLVDKDHIPGEYAVSFDAMNSNGERIASGEYFYTLEGSGFTLVRKMKLVK